VKKSLLCLIKSVVVIQIQIVFVFMMYPFLMSCAIRHGCMGIELLYA